MRRGEQWHWSIRTRAQPDSLIGIVSLMDDETGNNRGFWLDPAHHGRDMTEASDRHRLLVRSAGQAAAARAQGHRNHRLARISERSGMRLVATEERGFVSGRMPAEIWEITREEWMPGGPRGLARIARPPAAAGGPDTALLFPPGGVRPMAGSSRRLPPFSPRFPGD